VTTTTATPPNGKRLSPSDWATIVTLFQRGEKNIRELADQFGVSVQAVSKGLKARNIEKGSRLAEVVGEVDDAARAARSEKVRAANQQVDNYAKYFDVIAKLTMKRVIEGDRDGTLAIKGADILVLKNAAAIIEKARIENWEILGIEDLLGENADLPDLNVGEYTPAELDAIRDANEGHYNESLEDGEDEIHNEGDEPGGE
jgi:hypothetical protein